MLAGAARRRAAGARARQLRRVVEAREQILPSDVHAPEQVGAVFDLVGRVDGLVKRGPNLLFVLRPQRAEGVLKLVSKHQVIRNVVAVAVGGDVDALKLKVGNDRSEHGADLIVVVPGLEHAGEEVVARLEVVAAEHAPTQAAGQLDIVEAVEALRVQVGELLAALGRQAVEVAALAHHVPPGNG
jgi:hypothetical protein